MKTPAERLNGLRWRLRATRRLWSSGVEPHETFLHSDSAPAPDSSNGTTGTTGTIDKPAPNEEIIGPMFFVSGWVFFPESRTAKVEVFVDGESAGNARLALLRPDVAEALDAPDAISSGFGLAIEREVADLPEGPVTVEAVAWSVSGERHALDPVEVTLGGKAPEDAEDTETRRQPPPFPTPLAPPKAGPSVLVYTHQLGLGGAQLYLLDLLRGLVETEAGRITLVSAMDGSLRKEFEELDIPVHIHGALHDDFGSHEGRLEELAKWSEGRDFDVALLNTATVFTLPGAELSLLLGIPYIWAIHESFHPSVLWSVLSKPLRECAEASLANADTLLFEADATRSLFEADAGRARCVTLPYGLDLDPLDADRASFDGLREREEAGIPADAELIVCIGTIEPRKAQNTLAQAFDLVAGDHPHAHLAFVGGREDPDCEALEELIATRGSNGERMHVIPITPDVHNWYGMSDILVCASDVESLPRTVLEAMAWETPVLATSVFGIPELIDDGETGWLCEANDVRALAEGLERALASSPEERRRIGRRSRELVEERHSLPNYAREVSELLQAAIGRKRTGSSKR